jgi:hypothetical protein
VYVNVRYLYIIAVSILPIFGHTQEWVARYNGPGNGSDGPNAIAVDNAGNVYVTGFSYGLGTSLDYATVKYSVSGVEQWVARYNGPGDDYDGALAIAIDVAGNVCVTGMSYGSGTDRDYATVKYNPSGVEQWVARYNGPGNGEDRAYAIAFDMGCNVYITGRSVGLGSAEDYATLEYDSLGVEQWVARYDGPGNDYDGANAIAIDNANNVYVTGFSQGSGTSLDYATVKYNGWGVEQWVARYIGPSNHGDEAKAIALDNVGNVYVTGYSHGDYATIKYNSSGVQLWVARYNGPDSLDDGANAIAVDDAGNVYVTGFSYSSDTFPDYATLKYDSLGVERWVTRYNGPDNNYDCARAIVIDNVGNVYVTGESYGLGTSMDYATVKYDSLGIEQWAARYDGPAKWDEAYAIGTDDAGSVYVTGWSSGLGTDFDFATIKYSPTGIEERELAMKKEDEILTTIFSGSPQLPEGKKCKIYDITGRIVEPSKITRGIYFIEVEGIVTQKVVKVR